MKNEKIINSEKEISNSIIPENLTPLAPHKYPFWILYFISLIFISISYSFYLFPTYFTAAKNLHTGVSAYNEKNYKKAIHHLEIITSKFQTSKYAKIFLIKAYFATKEQKNYILALELLENLKISDRDWLEIKEVLPEYLKNSLSYKEKKG